MGRIGSAPITAHTLATNNVAVRIVSDDNFRSFLGVYNETDQEIYIAFINDKEDPTTLTVDTMIRVIDSKEWESNSNELITLGVAVMAVSNSPHTKKIKLMVGQ